MLEDERQCPWADGDIRGSDHAFFPPPDDGEKKKYTLWKSLTDNIESVELVESFSSKDKTGILGSTAASMFGLQSH